MAESGSGGRERFEDGLGDALRRAGAGFGADGRTLVDGGVLRGRRLLRRRRAGAVTGGVAALAVVGLGASYGVGAFGGGVETAAHSGVAAGPSATAHVSGEKVLGILERLVPEGEFGRAEGRGAGDPGGPLARVVYDDGKGKAAIGVSLGVADPGGAQVAEQLRCPDRRLTAYDSCTSETLSGGARLLLLRGYTYPDKRVDTKWWHAYYVTAEGYTVDVSEWNAPAEKGEPVSRPQPPLSLAQLRAVATSDEWRPVMKALGKAPRETAVEEPAPGPDRAAILKNVKALLPQRMRVVSEGGQDTSYAYVVVDDGKGASLVQVNVQPDMGDVRGRLFGGGARKLADGTLVETREGDGDGKGGDGVVTWTADTLREDGFRVVVSAVNSGSQAADATREKPALTLGELEELALSGAWHAK
ncbi:MULTISPECIES: hypothetical protein [unclassified Streptomyces]|uniref:hypothetical protein n=1 Tax=unclassified Streptomyces TaxID=2593676 RepID=UPI00278BEDD2|nr:MULTISPECIES: hypothetical protein [unclassified Streptomyces]